MEEQNLFSANNIIYFVIMFTIIGILVSFGISSLNDTREDVETYTTQSSISFVYPVWGSSVSLGADHIHTITSITNSTGSVQSSDYYTINTIDGTLTSKAGD